MTTTVEDCGHPKKRDTMKLGRNEACHCGSGRKYKKCHLDDDERRERIEALMPNFMDVAALHIGTAAATPGFQSQYMAPAENLNLRLRERIGEGLEGREAAELLATYLEDIEAEMAAIVAKHSRGYWMHVTRRIPPRPLGSASPWTVYLYRRVLTLAVLKHGVPATINGEFDQVEIPLGRQQIPSSLHYADIVQAFALEYLAFEYVAATQAYRRIGKGATLKATADDFSAIADTDELEELMQDLDRRVEHYGELVSSSGMLADREISIDRLESGDVPLFAAAARPNVKLLPAQKLSRHGGSLGGPANFLVMPLPIDGYRETFGTLQDEVLQATGLDPDVLLSTIWGLSMRLICGIHDTPTVESQILRVGYLLVPDENWGRITHDVALLLRILWERWTGERLDEAAALEQATEGLDALTWSEQAIRSISLWDRLPFKLIIDAGGYRLIDHAALPEMFADIFRQVSAAAERAGGGGKGANFEAAVAARARAEGFEPWMESRELHHQDGTEREIDVGIVSGDTLYVVECKARVRGTRIDRGDWSARRNREETLLDGLDQARTLTEFLKLEPTGADYKLPSEVINFEPVLCTPGPEFIWTRDSDLWLTDEIPRICTPGELILALKGSESAGA